MQLMSRHYRWRHAVGALAFLAATAFGLEASARSERNVSGEQKKLAQKLPQTMVLRVKKGTHKLEVAHLKQQLAPNSKSKAVASKAKFTRVSRDNRVMQPASWGRSWYWDLNEYYWYNDSYERSRYYDDYDYYDYSYDTRYWYYQPVYSYGGYRYPYNSYYTYSYGGYDYYYYGWPSNSWWY